MVTASSAAAAAAIVSILLQVPNGVLILRFKTSSLAFKLLTSLSFNVAKDYGFHIMATFEGTGMVCEAFVQLNISMAVFSCVEHKLAFMDSSAYVTQLYSSNCICADRMCVAILCTLNCVFHSIPYTHARMLTLIIHDNVRAWTHSQNIRTRMPTYGFTQTQVRGDTYGVRAG